MQLQSLVRLIYPAQCVACGTDTSDANGLCASCWPECRFLMGTRCDLCGTTLPGDADGEALVCDDCMTIARPWAKGRAALAYEGVGRRLVLALKHGDRTELAIPAAGWMQTAARDILQPDQLLVPVPLHRLRLLKRRYNQAALLSHALAKRIGGAHCPDALIRVRNTSKLDGHSRDERFAALQDAIVPHPRRVSILNGRDIALVDDVMTTGATLAACAEACHSAGARSVCIVTLARVGKDT